MYLFLKDMTEAEQDGKAYVHWKSWQESYRGLVDDDYLDQRITLERCRTIAHNWPENTVVAMVDGEVVGFACWCLCRDGDLENTGEIQAIYVLEAYQKQKIGYALMQEALRRLAQYPSVVVWVLKDNSKAIRFYEKLGFRADGAEQTLNMGKPTTAIRMLLEKSCG